MSFSVLPHGQRDDVKPFTLSTHPQSLEDMKTLLKLSRIAEPTYENTQEDQKYGVTRDWIQHIKQKWINFDWCAHYYLGVFQEFDIASMTERGHKSIRDLTCVSQDANRGKVKLASKLQSSSPG